MNTHFLKYIPSWIRYPLIRRGLAIKRITDRAFTCKVATTKEELEAAFGLLHQAYAGAHLMEPHPSGLRCNLYQALPYTTTVIAKFGEKVVGSVTLIMDSQIGLPSDKCFKDINDNLRRRGQKLCEVSALAIDRDFRRGDHAVSLYLMKYLFFYVPKMMGGTSLCITVHPRAIDFYKALLNFTLNSDAVEYGFVNGALAVHMSLECNVGEEWSRQRFPKLYEFMIRETAPFELPDHSNGCSMDVVMTPELLKYFFVEKTSVLKDVTLEARMLLKSAYQLHFSNEELEFLDVSDEVVPFRYRTNRITASLGRESRLVAGGLYDISANGIYVETREKLEMFKTYIVSFDFGHRHHQLRVKSCWENDEKSLWHPQGYGFRFLEGRSRIVDILRSLASHSTSVESLGAMFSR